MAFKLPDLILESIIRDGLENARRDETVIEDVFGDLLKPYAAKKYGEAEVNKIKDIIQKREISVVHSFNLVNANLPCISIQLADDREDEARTQIGNYKRNTVTAFATPEELASLTIVGSFTPTSYSPISGIVKVDDLVSLSAIHANHLFVDSAGTKHPILGGIVDVSGKKQFIIAKGATVDLGSGAEIKASIDYNVFIQKGTTENVQLILGIHTKDALLTKYLYILVKYFILSRQSDATIRGMQLSTYSGSDFVRNLEYIGDTVFTRFLNISGMLQPEWRADKVQLIDNVEVKILVEKDQLGNEALNLTNSTVQVKE